MTARSIAASIGGMKKILPALLLITALLAGVSPAAQAADPKGYDFYFRDGSTLTILDDESWPWDNEMRTFNLGGLYIGRMPYSSVDQTLKFSRCAGGEVRVDITLTGHTKAPDNYIKPKVELFEGASCNTNDHEDSQKLPVFYPGAGTWSSFSTIDLENVLEGGDWASGYLGFQTYVVK
jgi:hypothetical protein